MPVCGACNEVIVDAEGNERPEARIPHACRSCKKPLHSYLHESCNVHMPEDGEYFCNEQCEANLTFGGNSSSSPSESESMHPSPVRREDDAWDDENITIAQLMDAATASRRRGVVVPTGATREEAELAPVTEEPPAPAPIAAPVTEEPRAPALVAAPVRVDDDKLEDGSKLSLTDVVAVGARVAMSYMTVDGDKSSGKWWHGYVSEEVTHLSAGPPCQPYSKAGKGEGQEDPRDGIPAVLEAIEELLPLVVEIENVPEIQKYEGGVFQWAPVVVVGTCMMTILLKDELSRRWKKFNTHFFVIRFPQPRVILGVPFMRKVRMVVDVNSDTVSLYHQGNVVATKVTTEPSLLESTINSVLDCTHPLAFTMEDYTIPAGAGLGVRVQLPAVYEGLDVQLLPLPDSAREFFASKRGLRLHGPVVARCGAEGYVTVRINNFSDKSVVGAICGCSNFRRADGWGP
ncbi:hypothetical protein AB1Y20_022710 [Prymnesium parvum]|uniref:Uncharacterized protein n=1 Tax=Prymnesium parvum TaxID=97485 RepID=A0AB34JIP7_PRYPA